MNYQKNNGIYVKEGSKDGKTLTIFAGVHGNEKVGVNVLEKLINTLEVSAGKVYLVFANPSAIKKNVRQINKNLNRCFIKNNYGSSSEDARARELMKILDESDALIDLHASNNKNSTPFAICEEDIFELVEKFNVPIMSSGWDSIEPGGSDGYMFNCGKPAVCLECGYAGDGSKYEKLAEESVYKFLSFYGAIGSIDMMDVKKKHIKVYKVITKSSESLKFVKQFSDFENLEEGIIFAHDDKESYVATKDDIIIFPNLTGPIGSEACILGKEIKEAKHSF